MKKILFSVCEFGGISYTSKRTILGFLITLLFSALSYSQNPVTGATTTTTTATSSSYTEAGQLYEWGQGDNLILETVDYNGETYFLDNTFTQTRYNIVRVNGNGGISYERFGIYAQREVDGVQYSYAPSLPSPLSMATLLDSPIINRGANDVFKNATATAQNIERIDVLYVPFKIPNLPNLEKVGFIASEKDGNSSYKCAVVTSVDGSGNPLTFGTVITIQAGDYGTIVGDTEFELLANNTTGGNPVEVGFNDQNVGVTFISLSDLGIGINDTVYGISFFDDNVPDNADLLDVTNTSFFPNANGGGADINGGLGAIVTSIGTVSGTVYLDINNNGTKDSNEPGIPNVSVTILGSDGGIQTVETDSNGGYSGFVSGGSTTVTINESDPDLPPNFSRTEGSNPTVVFAIEGQDVSVGNTGYSSDFDNDGVVDLDDVDDDNDGILDTIELTIGATTYDPLGDEDGDTIVNYLDNSDDGTGDASTTDYTDSNTDGIPDVYDFDNDGIPNHLDLDADNDGIPDNIEAQTTNDYIAPSGSVGSGFTDANNNGLDDNYETAQGGTDITPVNSDSATVTDNPDYLDLDSDEDGTSDTIEANITLSGTVGENGLDNFKDNGDDYTDVNGSFDNTQTDNFPDDGNNASNGLPDDVNWRDSAMQGEIDTDNDGIPDSTDIDDDNDGILDTDEDETFTYNFTSQTSAESNWNFTAPGGNNLQAPNTARRWSWDNNDTTSNDVGPNIGQGDAGYVYTEMSSTGANGDVFIAELDENIDASQGNITFSYYFGYRGSENNGTIQLQSNENGAGWLNRGPAEVLSQQNISLGDPFEWIQKTVDLSGLISGNATRFRLVVTQGSTGTSWHKDVGLDTVTVTVNTDSDNDRIPNYLDLDSDNDGIPDNIEGQGTTGTGSPEYIAPTGGVGTNGLYDVYENNDTLSATSYTIENTDGTGDPDYLDLDSDDDGTTDRIEANLSLSGIVGANGLDNSYDNGDDYADVNGSFDNTPFNDFPDNPSGGEIDWRDDTSTFSDNDNDGIVDSVDLDDDNDGILDTVELTVDGVTYEPLGDEDGDSIVNYLDNTDNGSGDASTTDYTDSNADGIPDVYDLDNDGIPNHLDLDTDNDGIPDNIEAQTTQGYIFPDGVFDANGVDTAYTGGLTPVDTDGDGDEDYIETDSDNDGLSDTVEADLTLSGTVGTNGLDNNYDNGDSYIDVNGSFDNTQTDNFPDEDLDVFNTGDVDYRDDTFTIDIDQDGIPNEDDIDDDNDGILDTEEGLQSLLTEKGFTDLTTPSFGDNVGAAISPWVLESGTNTNVIQVDGTGGSTYGTGGPEFDATGSAGNYFTVNGSAGVIYQTFTLTEESVIDYGGYISGRDGNTGNGSIRIYSGTGTGGTLLSSTGPKSSSFNSTWKKIANTVTLPAGTYTYAVEMDENLNFDEAFLFAGIDDDGDGIVNHYDLDADNDGIPDNIEAQTTSGYITPSGSFSLSGLDLAYGSGLTPVNTDGTDEPDYLDLDSDNEGDFDIVESGAGLTDANSDGVADGVPADFGVNGLINSLETGDVDLGYTDVNGQYDNTFTTILTDTDLDVNSGGDLDYRDDIVGVDTDKDGVANTNDIDDDNDGIIDILENGTGALTPDAIYNFENSTDDASSNNYDQQNGAVTASYNSDNVLGASSIDFDGTYLIDYSDGTFLNQEVTTATHAVWIKPDDLTGTEIIIDEGGNTNGIGVRLNGTNLEAVVREGGSSATTLTIPFPNDNDWHHIAVTYDNGIFTLYLDGTTSTSVNSGFGPLASHTDDAGLGGRNNDDVFTNSSGVGDFYEGLMDEYYHFDTALTPEQIRYLGTLDFDADGKIDSIDIDADNDGIPDNVEAQTTLGYISPSGTGNGITDGNTNGLDDNYETAQGGTDITPNNHDGTDNPDYIDTDSDNDGEFDIAENQVSDGTDVLLDANTGTTTNGTPDGIVDPSSFIDSDGDGLADVFEGSDTDDSYDVNDEINTPSTDLPDEDSDVATDDVDYRDDDTDTITPGVVGNTLWLRADLDVTGGSNVTLWEDQTSSLDFVANGSPTSTTNLLNFNPTVTFTPADNDYLTHTGNLNPRTMYIVYNDTSTAQYTSPFTNDDGNGIGHGHVNDTQIYNATFTPTNVRNGEEYVSGLTDNFLTRDRPDNFELHSRIFLSNDWNSNFTYTVGKDRSVQANTRVIDGSIAEVMLFSDAHSDLKRRQIESYLAIKYGFTLSNDGDNDAIIDETISGFVSEGDYILADETTKVWDSEATYHNDVAGIGRDDAMVLNQKQSKSVNSDAIVTIGLDAIATTNQTNANTFTSNKDFLMWGNNDNSLLEADVTETELICAPEKTLARIWKVVESGNVASVQIAADKTTIDGALTTANTVKVFKIADDAAFTTNVEYIPVTSETINSEDVYTVDYNFSGTKYFTYSEINGIFWNGDSSTWSGGNSGSITGGPSTNIADRDKVMVIDSETSLTHVTLTEDVEVECVWIKENSKLAVQDNKYLEFDEDFILDGEVRLIDNGQLVQTHTGPSNVQGMGKLHRDQQATVPNVYRYHYWSSPVREMGLDTYRVKEVMKDGNAPTSLTSEIREITWEGEAGIYDGATGTVTPDVPIKIAPYWIYTFLNGGSSRSNWVQSGENSPLERGQGYTMKSTGQTPQNFTFVGTPNDGSITFDVDANTTSMLGNPYPSALDAVNFISTNLGAVDGTLYFWEHTGEDATTSLTEGHNFAGYQGGYSQRNIAMGVAASSLPLRTTTFDFDTATDNGSNISETKNGITITYTADNSLQNLDTSGDGDEGSSGNYLDLDNDTDDNYTSTISFNDDLDVFNIYVAKKGGSDVELTFTPDNLTNNSIVTETLTDANNGVTISLNWSEISSFEISGDASYNLIMDDIKVRDGDQPSIGTGTYNAPNRYVSVAQGFFISCLSSDSEIRFENSMRAFEDDNYTTDGSGGGSGTLFFKQGNSKRSSDNNTNDIDLLPILKLGFEFVNESQVELHRQIGISFRRANSFGYDNGYDSEIFDESDTDIYWNFPKYSDKKLIIAGVSEITSSLEVPIVLAINTDEPISLEIDDIKNITRKVYLIDKLTNVAYELSQSEKVTLNLDKGMYTERFYITFNEEVASNTLNTEEDILNDELTVYLKNDSKELILENKNGVFIKTIEIFNTLGQKVEEFTEVEKQAQNSYSLTELSASVYIVRILSEKGILSKKILIE